VDEREFLADRFEEHRVHLRAVAYRMLGSLAEADDAVQESWLRLSRSDADAVRNLGGWLTTVVGRVCLDMLRSRAARREVPLQTHVPDPIVEPVDTTDPEQQAVLAESVGLALLVVLDELSPAERLAFVLHDLFGVPFERIGELLDRSPKAAKQLASRARARVRHTGVEPEPDLGRQQQVVSAFLVASRGGDFDALLAVLDPDVVLRVDAGANLAGPGVSKLVRGAAAVCAQAARFSGLAPFAHLVLVNGSPGIVTAPEGRPVAVMAFTVAGGRIVEIDILADPDRLAGLDLPSLDG
jgi:RNA polymerase sigma factor (sigma-70 family)